MAAPTPSRRALRAALRLPDDVGLVLGNGSDEILQLVTTAVAEPGAAVLAPDPTFVMYRAYASHARMRYVGVPLRADFDARRATRCSPRSSASARRWSGSPRRTIRPATCSIRPTSSGSSARRRDSSSSTRPTSPIASSAFLPRVLEFPNLVVVRTLSKVGMAGMRLGYAAAHPAWIAEIDKLRSPYNVNALTQAVALALLAEGELFARQTAEVRAERGRLSIALAALPGVRVFASEANFVSRASPTRMRRSAHCAPQASWSRMCSGFHPLLAQLPAHHRRNARRKRRADRGARKKRMNAPAEMKSAARAARVERRTAETDITVSIDVDGRGRTELSSGIAFLDHMLDQIAPPRHVRSRPSPPRATCTSTRITRSRISASRWARPSSRRSATRRGIRRYGHAYVPLDEALSRVVVDLSGRPGLVFHVRSRAR